MWNVIVGCGWSWLQECAINNQLPSHLWQYRAQLPLMSKLVYFHREKGKFAQSKRLIRAKVIMPRAEAYGSSFVCLSVIPSVTSVLQRTLKVER